MPATGRLPDLLAAMKDWTDMYNDCADRHASLVRAIESPPEPIRWWQFWRIYW